MEWLHTRYPDMTYLASYIASIATYIGSWYDNGSKVAELSLSVSYPSSIASVLAIVKL